MLIILKEIGKVLLSAFLTEKFIKEFVIYVLEKLVVKTDNDIDDEIVKKIKEAMKVQ